MRRPNISRGIAGVVLLLLALALPWNVYFGMGIPNSNKGVLGLLTLATLLSLGSVAATYAGPWRLWGARANSVLAERLRFSFNAPYLLLVLAFVAFDAIQTVRYGGSVKGVSPN
jgi:hypothetical protein